MIFQTIIMYLIVCTLCLIFEVSIKKLYFFDYTKEFLLFAGLKTLAMVVLSVIISYILLKFILIKFCATFILPFFIILFILGFSILFELINPKIFKINTNDYVLCFISIFIATSEGNSLATSILISITSVCCYYLLLYMLFCSDKQNSTVIKINSTNTIPLLLLTLAIIILAGYSWNISWLSIRFF